MKSTLIAQIQQYIGIAHKNLYRGGSSAEKLSKKCRVYINTAAKISNKYVNNKKSPEKVYRKPFRAFRAFNIRASTHAILVI